MSVLVISIVMVAMAPVITKRVSDNISVADVKTQGVLFLPGEASGESCITQTSQFYDTNTNNTTCSFEIPDNVHSINAILVGNGGDGSDAGELYVDERSVAITYDMMNDEGYYDFYFENNDKNYVTDFEIPYASAGGGGGGSAWGEEISGEPQSQEDCDPYNSLYIKRGEYTDAICFNRYNVGDTNGANLAPGAIYTYTNGYRCPFESAGNCYAPPSTSTKYVHSWSSSTYHPFSYSSYAGNRKVLQFKLAKASCNGWNPNNDGSVWRLPNTTELKEIRGDGALTDPLVSTMQDWQTKKGTNYTASDLYVYFIISELGLNICSYSEEVIPNGIRCPSTPNKDETYPSKCQQVQSDGSTVDKHCTPAAIWTIDDDGDPGYFGSYHGAYFYSHDDGRNYTKHLNLRITEGTTYSQDNGTFDETSYLSGRCVSSDLGTRYKVHTGGGGGAGNYQNLGKPSRTQYAGNSFTGLTSDEYKLRIWVGKGGKGGTQSSEPDKGGDTIIQLFKKNNSGDYEIATDNDIHIWDYTIYGGSAGKNGTSNSEGVGGTKSTYSHERNHQKYTASGYVSYIIKTANTYDNSGFKGEKISGLSSSHSAKGGAGRLSNYENDGSSTSVDGGTFAQPTAIKPNIYGSGGGGGSATIDDGGNLVLGNGADGADGVVVIKYRIINTPIVGAGGAGGGMVIGKNIKVNPKEKVKVSVPLPSYDPYAFSSENTRVSIYEQGSDMSGAAKANIVVYSGLDSNGLAKTEVFGEYEIMHEEDWIYKTSSDQISSYPGIVKKNGKGECGGASTSANGDFQILCGEDGQEGFEIWGTVNGNYTNSGNVAGGRGGRSASGSLGGCGGAFNFYGWHIGANMDSNCLIRSQNLVDGSAPSFNINENAIPNGDFGSAGAGGGGGGYIISHDFSLEEYPKSGKGGKGQKGYVYIWWTTVD